MRKLNSVIYQKLLIQANEAKTQQLTKLAFGIVGALGPMAEDEHVQYEYKQLQNEVYEGMWRLATHVIKYHDVESADAGKIHDRLEVLADKFIEELEQSLGVEDVIAGPLEPKLFGEKRAVASKIHRDKRNGYLAFKDGTWGVGVYSKTPPEPGDKVWIDLSYVENAPAGETSSEEFVAQTVGETRNLKGQVQYECTIQSQDDAERILGGKPV